MARMPEEQVASSILAGMRGVLGAFGGGSAARPQLPLRTDADNYRECHLRLLVGNVAGAQSCFESALAVRPRSAADLFGLASALLVRSSASDPPNHGLSDRAHCALRAVSQLLPASAIAAAAGNDLGASLLHDGRAAEAAATFAATLSAFYAAASPPAGSHTTAASSSDATAVLEGSIDREATVASLWSNLGLSFDAQHRWTEALRAHAVALNLAPDAGRSYLHVGNVVRQLSRVPGEGGRRGGLQPGAELPLLRQAVQLTPDGALPARRLAQSLQEVGQLAEARSLFARARSLAPLGSHTASTLGWRRLAAAALPTRDEADDSSDDAERCFAAERVEQLVRAHAAEHPVQPWLADAAARLASSSGAEGSPPDAERHSVRCPSISAAEADALGTDGFYARYVRVGVPVVVRGAAHGWPARRKWSLEALARRHGDAVVAVQLSPRPFLDPPEEAALWTLPQGLSRDASGSSSSEEVLSQPAHTEMRLAEFVALSRRNTSHLVAYLRQLDIDEQLPSLSADLQPPLSWAAGMAPTNNNLWASAGGTITGIHMATYDNVLTQISGQKAVMLAPPEAWRAVDMREQHMAYLAAHPARPDEQNGGERDDGVYDGVRFERRSSRLDTVTNRSPVDYAQPNASRHPRYASLSEASSRRLCVLGGGDALFLPAYWWHAVTSIPDGPGETCANLATNTFYRSEAPWPAEFPTRFARAQ